MSKLFAPLARGALALPNRIVIAPMCQYSADTNGMASDWHLIHYGSLALSGAGLLIFEASAVAPEGRISNHDLGLWSDENATALGAVVRRIRQYSTMPLGVQLGHAGRKGSKAAPWIGGTLAEPDGGWQLVAPSAIPFDPMDTPPQELDETGLQHVVSCFAEAAARAARAGFDTVEIHAAHGYLLHQFLSPLSNTRGDFYGGSLENRMRLPLQVFDAVRAAFPQDKPVGIRISGADWVDGGWTIEQSIHFAKALEKRGCNFIHVSGGGLSPQQRIELCPGYQVPLAARIKESCSIPTICVGLITEAEQAENILQSGDADMIGIARAVLFNPHWPWQAAARLGAAVKVPPQYLRSQPHGVKDLFVPDAS